MLTADVQVARHSDRTTSALWFCLVARRHAAKSSSPTCCHAEYISLTCLDKRSIVYEVAAARCGPTLSMEGAAAMTTHPIVHVEIPARDLEAASQFYAQVFDWRLDSSMPEYPMFQAEGGPGGAFVAVRDEASEHGLKFAPGEVLIYLGTDDIDAALIRVEAHG